MRIRELIPFIFLAIIAGSCATPTQPTGGPPDTTPPAILSTSPKSGTVNFDGDEIRFNFSKYIERASFASAFRVDPDFNLKYSVRWSGRSVRVRFEEPLPDSTTIIFTIGTELADTQRNRIRAPYVMAISTGPQIDMGELEGRILSGKTGRSVEGTKVALYRVPYDLELPAEYIAETDSAGRVHFQYLRDGEYFAFWLDDRNRNRIWDRGREAARPFYKQYVGVSSDAKGSLGTMYHAEPDTVKPTLQGVGMFSSQRLRLRYSREMSIHGDSAILVQDSLGNTFTDAVPLYVSPDDRTILFAHAGNPIPPGQSFTIASSKVTDVHGNPVKPGSPTFEGSAARDTTRVKMIRHLTPDGVLADMPHVFQFSTLIEGTTVRDSMQVVQDEIIYTAWVDVEIENNLLYLYPPGKWEEGSDYTVRFFDDFKGSRYDIRLKIFPFSRLGSLAIELPDHDNMEGMWHRVRLIGKDEAVHYDDYINGPVVIENLPAGEYTLLAYMADGPGKGWFPGTVEPYSSPAPKMVERGIRVHERMEGTVALSYRMLEKTGEDWDDGIEDELDGEDEENGGNDEENENEEG